MYVSVLMDSQEQCVKVGMAWLDEQAPEPLFWFPSLYEKASH